MSTKPKTIIPLIITLTNWPCFRCCLIVVAFVLAGSALLPGARAVNPPPDGGYPGFNTAEGQNAMLNLDTTTGFANTAIGSFSLQSSINSGFNTAVGAGTLTLNTGNENTAVGAAALLLNTTGEDNTAVGVDALLNNTIGEANTAIGDAALLSNTTGGSNTAAGALALFGNTTGTDNTAIGDNALASNTTGSLNTAIGVAALVDNSTGGSNTAVGVSALAGNTTGNNNTATGVAALVNNTIGSFNTATGLSALHDNTLGESNTAVGDHALFANIDGNGNTAIGTEALTANGSGNDNTATGLDALHNNAGGSGNTAVGSFALSNIVNGNFNVAVGENAGENLTAADSNNIDIGFDVVGVAGESNTIRIGNPDVTTTIVRGISGQTIPSGTNVLVAANGQLGTATSSKRFKEKIRPMDEASKTLFSLKPVTFRYKKEIDPAGAQQFGLIAEEVEKINPDLIVRDENGHVNTVRYDQVNAMLLNEFLKEHRKNEDQQATVSALKLVVAEQEKRLRHQEKQIAMLMAAFEQVSTLREINRPAPRLVGKND